MITKKTIMDKSIKFVKTNNRYPQFNDLVELGITRAKIRQEFGTLESLKNVLHKNNSELVFDLTRSKTKAISKRKRYIITAAEIGGEVDLKFLKNLKLAAKTLNAELIVGTFKNGKNTDSVLDKELKDLAIVLKDEKLNDNLFILGIISSAKQVNPTTGLARVGKREGTIITFSPKQSLNYYATGFNTYPTARMSTGAVTKPNYNYKGILPDIGSYLAAEDHKMGAIIIEIQDNKIYYPYQIQADKDGNFVHLGKYFKNGKVSTMLPEAVVLGDWHTGATNPLVAKGTFNLIRAMKPKTIFLHDAFDGLSVNPHIIEKRTSLARMAEAGKLSLKDELKVFAKEIEKFAKLPQKTYIVESNHNEFLDRYLERGAYVKHPYNKSTAEELSLAKSKGLNPLQYSTEKILGKKKNIIWLERNDSVRIAGIELAYHGDRGSNGAKATVRGLEQSFLNCVVGHAHTPQIMRGVYVVGTSTDLHADYGPGYASSWMNTHCLVYPNGQRQMINIINGKWRI